MTGRIFRQLRGVQRGVERGTLGVNTAIPIEVWKHARAWFEKGGKILIARYISFWQGSCPSRQSILDIPSVQLYELSAIEGNQETGRVAQQSFDLNKQTLQNWTPFLVPLAKSIKSLMPRVFISSNHQVKLQLVPTYGNCTKALRNKILKPEKRQVRRSLVRNKSPLRS